MPPPRTSQAKVSHDPEPAWDNSRPFGRSNVDGARILAERSSSAGRGTAARGLGAAARGGDQLRRSRGRSAAQRHGVRHRAERGGRGSHRKRARVLRRAAPEAISGLRDAAVRADFAASGPARGPAAAAVSARARRAADAHRRGRRPARAGCRRPSSSCRGRCRSPWATGSSTPR